MYQYVNIWLMYIHYITECGKNNEYNWSDFLCKKKIEIMEAMRKLIKVCNIGRHSTISALRQATSSVILHVLILCYFIISDTISNSHVQFFDKHINDLNI